MPLPVLYVEGLRQRALLGREQLSLYKLGLIEAVLKEALRGFDEKDPETIRSSLQTALDVARWEMRPSKGSE